MRTEQRFQRLLSRADDLRYQSPRHALRLAEKVRDEVAGLDPEILGSTGWHILQAEAWGVLGSAFLGVGDLRSSEEALNVALAFLEVTEDPPASPLKHARLARRAAILRCGQRRFSEALELVGEALEIYRVRERSQELACSLADRGIILGFSGRMEEAISHLAQALDQIDPRRNPRYYLGTVHNMALYLHEVAETPAANELALDWLRLAIRCHRAFPENVNLLKLQSLQGLISLRLGRFEDGIKALSGAQEGFKRLGAFFEQAIVLLHVADAYLGQDRPRDVKRVAGELFPLFRRLDTDREVSAALMLFDRAAQAETVTHELIDKAADTLRRHVGCGVGHPQIG